MTLHWPLILLGAFFYLLIGVAQAMAAAFISGRRGTRDHGDEHWEILLMFFWPFLNLIWLAFMAFSKLCDLFDFCRKRGEQSVLPKDEPARRID